MPSVFDVTADNIVNPRCDECGASVEPVNPALGPHLCFQCRIASRAAFEANFRDYLSQERPDRKVHVVKLPPDFNFNRKRRPAMCAMGEEGHGKTKPTASELVGLYRALVMSMESIAERSEAVLNAARQTLERLEAEIDDAAAESD